MFNNRATLGVRVFNIWLFVALAISSIATADIYRWDNGQVIPGTEGITPGPGVQLDHHELAYAELNNRDLTGSRFDFSNLSSASIYSSNLTSANLSEAKLANASLNQSTLTSADLSGAVVTGTNLNYATGFTKEQLYSTASYRAKTLSGIGLGSNNLSGWDLSGQNLANAHLGYSTLTSANLSGAKLANASLNQSTLTSADLSGAVVTGADFHNTTARGFTKEQLYSTASYQAKTLSGIGLGSNNLSGWDLSGQNLANAGLYSATLTSANLSGANLTNVDLSSSKVTNTNLGGANLTDANLYLSTLTNSNLSGAVVVGTSFTSTTPRGFTQAQLQSTASYQAKDLQGIGLGGNDLTGWDFSGQDLTGASLFGSTLTGANLSGAAVVGAFFNITTSRGFTQSQLQSTASYQAKNLQGIGLELNDLTSWDFNGQDLTGADLQFSTLTAADLRGAVVVRASFAGTTSRGFTQAQLQSTASYQAKDLQGIGLDTNDLTGWDFSGQDLTGASLSGSTLTGADLTSAIVTGANFTRTTSTGFTMEQFYSTASYQAKNLQGIGLDLNDLTSWDFNGQDLTGANLADSKLTGANLVGAIVAGADFGNTTSGGFTKEQLYSTASYQQKNLRGIGLSYRVFGSNDLTGWDFSGQDLTGANLTGSTLTNANMSNANLTDASLSDSTLTNADLTGADLRGAWWGDLTGAIFRNTILSDGSVLGLYLTDGDEFVVRDDDGVADPPPAWWVLPPRSQIAISVHDHFAMSDGGVLRMIFESDPWDSLISFESGIPVQLGGTLELMFADETDVSTQVGRTLRIFDWTGVTPTGAFSVASPYIWDLSHLYSAGDVTLLAIPEPTAIALVLCSVCTLILFAGRVVACRFRVLSISLLILFATSSTTNADIYRWDNGQVIPGTVGIIPGPGMLLPNRQLEYASLSYADLTGSSFRNSNVSYADLSGSNLTNANFDLTKLTGANLVGAIVTGAGFSTTTSRGFAKEQLYSTASYQQKNLQRIRLGLPAGSYGGSIEGPRNDLTGWDFSDQDLTNASLSFTVLANANFLGAIVNGTDFGGTTSHGFTKEQLYSTASYQQKNLQRISLGIRLGYIIGGTDNDLTDWDFSGQDLTNANFKRATMTNTNLAGAIVKGANFGDTTSSGFTKEQLYSTASYQQKDLQGIIFEWPDDLSSWDFSGQNLTRAHFGASYMTGTKLPDANLANADFYNVELTNANLASANLVNANFHGAELTGADFTGAMITGAGFFSTTVFGFTKEQLYSTASYQEKNLQGIGFGTAGIGDPFDDLTGWDLSGQNLTNAKFNSSTLTDVKLAQAIIEGTDFGNTTSAGFAKEQLYSTASYQAKNLAGIGLGSNDLTSWDLIDQNLKNASFDGSTLTNANFTVAIVTGADFSGANFTKEQLYSTASYQQKNLQGIGLSYDDLSGWDLSDQDLTNASFGGSTLTNANFTGAIVVGAAFPDSFTKEQLYSTASYQQKHLQRMSFQDNDLTGWDLSNQDLTNAILGPSTLTNANFNGAIVVGTRLDSTTSRGFTKEQLYSTASYHQHELRGINLYNNNLSGWDFNGQNLANADFGYSTLTNADFTGANLTGADLYGATLNNADFSAADLRGAVVDVPATSSSNAIHRDGTVVGLDLAGGNKLVVRDDDGWVESLPIWHPEYRQPRSPIPITVREHFAMSDGSILRLVFESDPWDSLISFEPDIPVQLGGTLELTFAGDTDVSTQLGRTLRIFDWTGVTPTGVFSVESFYQWDLSRLYTAGEVTLLAIPEPTTGVLLVCSAFVSATFLRNRRNRWTSQFQNWTRMVNLDAEHFIGGDK